MSEPNQEEFVRVNKEQLHRLIQENKTMKMDIGEFLRDGPGQILAFLGDKNSRPIVALGKAMKEFMRNPDTFKKTGVIGGKFIEKYKNLVIDETPLKTVSKNEETNE